MVHAARRVALSCCLLVAVSVLAPLPLVAVEDAQSTEQADKKKSLEVMLERAKRLSVQVGTTPNLLQCELKDTPLIHYSDQVRQLPESTLWIWEQKGVPKLFCKIERLAAADGTTKMWQYCCAPATDEKVDVTWGRDFRWRSREFPFRYAPLADAPEPRDQPRARLTQMKSIAREFSGQTEQTPANNQQEMRLLSSPLHQYTAPTQNIIDGAVFGLTSNGTNPDALLLIEAVREPETKATWRYAVVGLTGDGANVLHKTKKVWSKSFSNGPSDYRDWMWYISPP